MLRKTKNNIVTPRRLAAFFYLSIVATSLTALAVDEPKKNSDEPKPSSEASKPVDGGGVSISLKLQPAKQETKKDSDTSSTKPKTSEQPKPSEPKAPAGEKNPGNEQKTPARDDSNKESSPKAESSELDDADKKQSTGTVELKLIPPKPAEPEKKSADESNTSAKPATIIPVPSGTVEMLLSLPKQQAEPAPKSGTVVIELTQPRPKANSRSISDNPVGDLKPLDKLKRADDLKKPASDSTPPSKESNKDASKSPSSTTKTRGGDPGDPGEADAGPIPVQPGDLPLSEESHPFDAPAAKATKEESRFSKTPNGRLLNSADRDRNQQITDVLEYFKTHHENVVRRGPWALMHTILPYGVDTEIIAGKQRVNAIGWLCHNGVSAKQRIFQPTQTGFRTNVGPGVQGHEGQFLAVLAQSHVHPDYPIQIGNKAYTINDLVKYEMATCREKTELTFKLIGFSHYLEPNRTWKDNRGRPWSIEKIVGEELAQPIIGEACGGTHRLMGLTCAIVSRQEAGLPLTGHFERAEKFLNDYVEYALSLQNPDGSFSTEWFERRAEEQNVERKVQTTGHILEWLVYTLPDDHLKTAQIENAIDFLLNTIGKTPDRDWPIGPRGHSLRALDLYQKRVYKGQEVSTETNLAKPASKNLQR